MIRYTMQRIVLIVLTLFIVLTINFFLLRLMSGTPFDNPKITPAQQEMMKNKYGLNDPAFVQYLRYIKGVVRGDLGASFKLQDQPVTKLIKGKLPHTVKIGTIALIVGVIVGIFLGALAAIYKKLCTGSLGNHIRGYWCFHTRFCTCSIFTVFLMC